jgi:hypothetical protein
LAQANVRPRQRSTCNLQPTPPSLSGLSEAVRASNESTPATERIPGIIIDMRHHLEGEKVNSACHRRPAKMAVVDVSSWLLLTQAHLIVAIDDNEQTTTCVRRSNILNRGEPDDLDLRVEFPGTT